MTDYFTEITLSHHFTMQSQQKSILTFVLLENSISSSHLDCDVLYEKNNRILQDINCLSYIIHYFWHERRNDFQAVHLWNEGQCMIRVLCPVVSTVELQWFKH